MSIIAGKIGVQVSTCCTSPWAARRKLFGGLPRPRNVVVFGAGQAASLAALARLRRRQRHRVRNAPGPDGGSDAAWGNNVTALYPHHDVVAGRWPRRTGGRRRVLITGARPRT